MRAETLTSKLFSCCIFTLIYMFTSASLSKDLSSETLPVKLLSAARQCAAAPRDHEIPSLVVWKAEY